MFLYLLSISLPFHLVCVAVFGVAFLYAGSLWFLFIVEVGVGRVTCQCFLVRETCISVLVGGAGSLLSECNEASSSEFCGVYGFGVTFGSLYINAQGYIPALLEN